MSGTEPKASARAVLKACRNHLKTGEAGQALERLRGLLRANDLPPLTRQRAGALVADCLSETEQPALRLHLLGRCTTTWLAPLITAAAWADGARVVVREGDYDTVLQSLDASRRVGTANDVVLLLPWHQGLLSAAGAAEVRSVDERLDDELRLWQTAWRWARGAGSRVVQVGYDWIVPGAAGYLLSGQLVATSGPQAGPSVGEDMPEVRPGGGDVALVRALNDRLQVALDAALPTASCFVDLPLISGDVGRHGFYDLRRYHWTKQPFSESGCVVLAAHLWISARALVTGPKKVLVLDLDNTLWGGVVGERGGAGVELGDSPEGEAFRRFQHHCKALGARGVVLAVASKNNLADARTPFESHPDMVLQLDHFAAFEASWEPKDVMLRRIASDLRLGLEHFVFFDDNPAERERIRQALPEVAVIEVPPDPAEYVRALTTSLAFEAATLTAEDRARSADYRAEHHRRKLRDERKMAIGAEEEGASIESYLQSLDMRADVRPIDKRDLPRVLQLFAKTNQWNLTTRRHGESQVRRWMEQPRAIGLSLRLRDRFGANGLVAVLLAGPREDDPSCLYIDSWLMSCRVIGRSAEQFLFGELVQRAHQLGYRRLLGDYRPTAKNAPVADLYEQLGFTASDDDDTGHPETRRYQLSLGATAPNDASLPWTAVRAESEARETADDR